MRQDRNHREEYRRRIARAEAKGLSRSQARGHPKSGEPPARSSKPSADKKIDHAIRAMHEGSSLTGAAKAARVSSERLRRYLKTFEVASRVGRAWVLTDNRPRRVPIIVGSSLKVVVVPNFGEASKAGRYSNAVGKFVDTGELHHIEPFEGDGVRDLNGEFHPFETDPNDLLRYAMKDEPEFHEIYQIVAN